MDPVDALLRLGGVASSGELIGATTRARLRTAVAHGRVVHLKHDRYGLIDLSSDRRTAGAAGGVVSHLSAALAWDWKVKHPPLQTHVTVPSGARRPTQEVALHWGQLADSEVRHGVTSPVRTVIDCAKSLPFDEALAVADSALRGGEVDRHQLLLAAQSSSRTGRSKAIEVIEAADAGAANPFESVVRATALSVPGLTVETQGEIDGVGFVDLLDRRLGIVVEAESFEFHSSREALRRDVTRYPRCTWRGLTVVRFLWEEAMFDPEYVRQVLCDVTAMSEVRLAQARKRRSRSERPT